MILILKSELDNDMSISFTKSGSFMEAMKIHKIFITSKGVIRNLNEPCDVSIRMFTTRSPGVSGGLTMQWWKMWFRGILNERMRPPQK